MEKTNTILEVRDLTKSYQDLVAVDHIGFDVSKGEVFGFLGPNGAGKTTTISMICGLLKPDEGDVVMGGRSMKHGYRHRRKAIGLCPQDIVIWELMTCLEQLMFVGVAYGMTRKEAKDSANQLLSSLGLQEKRNKLAGTLSGGMKRRLNIALALVHDPDLIILDEPQAGLDPQSRLMVRDFIKHLASDKTVILTTHDMDEADRLSDRVAIIDHGKILAIDTAEKLKQASGIGDVLQIGVENLTEVMTAGIVEALPFEVTEVNCSKGYLFITAHDLVECVPLVSEVFEKHGIGLLDMTVRKRTLEDAFIAMTGRGLRE